MKKPKILEYAPEDKLELIYICGIDEVGRGCGAGPVVSAAVILPKDFSSPLIRDSKKLSEKQRNEAYELILKNAISISCNAGSVTQINELGIDKTTFKTFYKSIGELSVKPEHILVDGNSWTSYDDEEDYTNIITLVPKGDDTYTSIAAAAIVAKVRRDEYMKKLHDKYPQYNWSGNKGYLTPDHISAIKEIGPNKYHRTKYIRNFVK